MPACIHEHADFLALARRLKHQERALLSLRLERGVVISIGIAQGSKRIIDQFEGCRKQIGWFGVAAAAEQHGPGEDAALPGVTPVNERFSRVRFGPGKPGFRGIKLSPCRP